jgi:hypothetical protein
VDVLADEAVDHRRMEVPDALDLPGVELASFRLAAMDPHLPREEMELSWPLFPWTSIFER